ncbi:hypothetical protein HS048_22910 [Planomonospora sp. ID91781]|uniref:hypothetical protein n=1 Tax=Planomonospora sp. ID91781 TaxID=2738135 RepID=UPI0018C36F92|nr:hypothetical protein [Planomonospora sp. ID91781]MBG0823577.1 hypothetical protein [Planomonospora sp. ID91781]
MSDREVAAVLPARPRPHPYAAGIDAQVRDLLAEASEPFDRWGRARRTAGTVVTRRGGRRA